MTFDSDGSFTYDQDGRFNYLADGEIAKDTFQYIIKDSSGATDSATVTIWITGANDKPTVNANPGLAYSTDEDTSLVMDGDTVLGSLFTDPDTNDSLHVFHCTASLGKATWNEASRTFTYDPTDEDTLQGLDPGDSVEIDFTIEVVDDYNNPPHSSSDIVLGEFKITVNGKNDPPQAKNDSGAGYRTDEDSSFTNRQRARQ